MINVETINDKNSSLSFPLYNALLDMREGENPITLLPYEDFDFFTSDGSFFGYVKVVDDISKVNIQRIKEELKDYEPVVREIEDTSGLPSCH